MKNSTNHIPVFFNCVIRSILISVLFSVVCKDANGQMYHPVSYKDRANPITTVGGVNIRITQSADAGTVNTLEPFALGSTPVEWEFEFCPPIDSLQMRIVMASSETVAGRQAGEIFINDIHYPITKSMIKSFMYPNSVISVTDSSVINKTDNDPLKAGIVPSGILKVTNPTGPIYRLKVNNMGSTMGAGSFWSFGLDIVPPLTIPQNDPKILPLSRRDPINGARLPVILCQGDSVILMATSISRSGPTYYQWLFNGNYIDNATSSTYATTVAGSYSVIVNCNLSPPINITVQPSMGISLEGVDPMSLKVYSPNGRLNHYNGLTFEGWIKTSDSYYDNTIIDFSSSPLFCDLSVKDGVLSASVLDNSEKAKCVKYTVVNQAIPLNIWTHVAFTWSKESAFIFVDGELAIVAVDTIERNISGYGGYMQIGRNNRSTASNLKLDEVRLWFLQRSKADMLSAMNCELKPSDMSGLYAYYKFNNNSSLGDDSTVRNNNLHAYTQACTLGVVPGICVGSGSSK